MQADSRLRQVQEMLVSEPQDVFLNYALALELLKDAESLTPAEIQLRRVLELDPTYVPAHYQLARLLESQKKSGEALALYRKGLELSEQKGDRKTAGEFREAIFMLED